MLGEVRVGGRHLAPTLDRALRELPERVDRAFVTDVAYGTLRHLRALEAALAPRLGAPERLPERILSVLLAGAYERLLRGTPAHAAVHAWVEAVKRGPARERGLAGLVNAVLRRLDATDLPTPLGRACLAPWLAERFDRLLGDDADAAALGMLEAEPLWCSAADPDGARQRLEAEGVEVAEGPVPGSLRLRSPVPLGALGAYLDGLVQPQNPASLAVVHACGPVDGLDVLDLCGGSGVKGAALAARGARVTSVERDAAKLAAGSANAARLGVTLTPLRWDLRTPPPLPPHPLVLLDAPCSGTGTLRGHPEIGLHLAPDAVARLAELQATLLRTAASLVAPGGRLVYAVCALTPEEGPERAAAFLAEHGAFDAVDPGLPDGLTRPAGHGRVTLPVDGLDGFFVASFVRRPGGEQAADARRA